MDARPIDQLIFKGTHNSYSCTGEDTPAMLHPVNVQIDDFGVWALELDYGVKLKNGNPVALVGHDDEGQATCFMPNEFELVQHLRTIRGSRSLQYRPVLIYFDIKDWDEQFSYDFKLRLGIEAARDVFGSDFIELKNLVDQSGGHYPNIHDLSGKAVLYLHPGQPSETLRGSWQDHCTRREYIETAISTGNLPDGVDSCGPAGCRVLRLDQYQADWTFDYGVPPNPIIVDDTARTPTVVQDAYGDRWDCDNGDFSHGEIVGEQGTFRFPYRTVGRAITRAEGTTPNDIRDPRRAGFGWTILIKPGLYTESLTIDVPLTLRKDDRFGGTVVIAGQPGRIARSLWITFHTNDDDKDDDTQLVVELRSTSGRTLASYQQGRKKLYKDGYLHTEYLPLNGVVSEEEMKHATLVIDIQPNGNDTWRFDWRLDGTWSDGAAFSDQQSGLALDQDNRQYERPLRV
jgi:hypothetical protein